MKIINALKLRLIDRTGGLDIYRVLKMLRHEQYMPVDQLQRIRQEKLSDLMDIAKRSTVYYADYTTYEEIPALTKNIISQHPSHFLSNLYKGKLVKKSTSGSTGTPFFYQSSVEAQSYLWAGMLLSWESAGYVFGEKIAFIAGSALIKNNLKHKIFYKLMNIDLYPAAIMTGEVIAGYIEMIKQKNTRLIYGYAMAINTIADYILEQNISPPQSLCCIVSTAEMLTDEVRANIEKAFRVKVFDQYGCNEAGIAAFECEKHRLHLISSRCVFEISEEGVLLSTDLSNQACIFMKYDTGDIVEFSPESCSCGRSFPVIQKIVGRTADVITDRNNKKIHCAYFNYLFKDDKSIRQYQVFFDERSIKINLKVNNSFTEKNYAYYMSSIMRNLDFEQYDIKTNEQFYTGNNLKHTFIIDKRKYKQSAA